MAAPLTQALAVALALTLTLTPTTLILALTLTLALSLTLTLTLTLTQVNGCPSSALHRSAGVERRLSVTEDNGVTEEGSVACAYALKCECTHLTDFAGAPNPLTLGT